MSVLAVFEPGGDAATLLYIVSLLDVHPRHPPGHPPDERQAGQPDRRRRHGDRRRHDAAARRDRQLGNHLRRPARRRRGRRDRLDPRADDRDAADGRPLQRGRRRRGRPDRLVGVPPRALDRLRLPARGVHPDPLRRRDRLGLLLGLEHRLRQAPGHRPDRLGRRCPGQQIINGAAARRRPRRSA